MTTNMERLQAALFTPLDLNRVKPDYALIKSIDVETRHATKVTIPYVCVDQHGVLTDKVSPSLLEATLRNCLTNVFMRGENGKEAIVYYDLVPQVSIRDAEIIFTITDDLLFDSTLLASRIYSVEYEKCTSTIENLGCRVKAVYRTDDYSFRTITSVVFPSMMSVDDDDNDILDLLDDSVSAASRIIMDSFKCATLEHIWLYVNTLEALRSYENDQIVKNKIAEAQASNKSPDDLKDSDKNIEIVKSENETPIVSEQKNSTSKNSKDFNEPFLTKGGPAKGR